MATLTLTPQEELRRLTVEAQELHGKGPLEGANAVKMGELLERMRGLRTHIEQGDALSDVAAFAGKSAGMLPLAAGNGGRPPDARLETLTFAGGTTVQTGYDGYGMAKSMELLSQYGEGIFDPKIKAVIGADDYREAFRSYMRKGPNALKMSELKTLQEGADQSGGLAE